MAALIIIFSLFSGATKIWYLSAFFFLFFYVILLLTSLWAVKKIPEIKISGKTPQNRFSILVAFKDESPNLEPLLASLQKLNYDTNNYEIILIDDHSVDNSAEIVQKNNFVRYIKNNGTGKKEALLTGIEKAQYEWIVTTDADCKVPPDWLLYFDAALEQYQPKMILAPVSLKKNGTFLGRFQQYEFLSLQALTTAGVYYGHPFLSNGANSAFEKQAFTEVNGYQGHLHIASGDDVFLLEKFRKKYPGKIIFIKNTEALVQSLPQADLKSLIQQKIRWAGKTGHYQSIVPKLAGIIMVLTNLSLILFWIKPVYTFIGIFTFIKFFIDTWLIYTISKTYKLSIHFFSWFTAFLLYPVYLIYLFFHSFKKGYEWKGRRYKR